MRSLAGSISLPNSSAIVSAAPTAVDNYVGAGDVGTPRSGLLTDRFPKNEKGRWSVLCVMFST